MRPVALEKELERIAEERLAAEREATHAQRWELFRACGECVGWCFIGLFMMGFAVHTTDAQLGGVLLVGGMLIGYVGMFTSLLFSYRRAHDRGDLYEGGSNRRTYRCSRRSCHGLPPFVLTQSFV